MSNDLLVDVNDQNCHIEPLFRVREINLDPDTLAGMTLGVNFFLCLKLIQYIKSV